MRFHCAGLLRRNDAAQALPLRRVNTLPESTRSLRWNVSGIWSQATVRALFCREPVATWSPTIAALAAQPDCVQVVLENVRCAADQILDVVVLGVYVAARELVGTA